MKKTIIVISILYLGFTVMEIGQARAAEFWVDQKAKTDGDGSAASPFQMISKAIERAKGGDTVTVKGGVYREHLTITKKGTADKPFTLRGAAGEMPVVSGFKPITGWQKFKDNIYTTTVDWPVRDLYVGYLPQFISRDQAPEKPWHLLAGMDGDKFQIKADDTLPLPPKLANAKNAFLFAVSPSSLNEWFFPITEWDPAAKVLKIDMNAPTTLSCFKWNKSAEGFRFIFCNDVSLITQPGWWTYEPMEGKKTRLYFWPKTPADLEKTQSRPGISLSETPGGPMVHIADSSYVRVEGLEIAGGGDSMTNGGGVSIEKCNNITIESCLIHDCGATSGVGINTMTCSDLTIRRNVVLRSRFGILVNCTHRATVEQCEVGYTYNDASRITGAESGWPKNRDRELYPKDYRTSDGCIFRNNYLHHALYVGHSDCIQSWAYRQTLYDSNLIMFGGHSMITGLYKDLTVSNNVMIGGMSAALCIEASKHQANPDTSLVITVTHNTIAVPGLWALQYVSGKSAIDNNLVYGHVLEGGNSRPSEKVKVPLEWEAHGNLEWPFAPTANNKLDPKTVSADPQMKNMPQAVAIIASKEKKPTTASRLYLNAHSSTPKDLKGFAVGDNVEVNGDGVVRHVTAVDEESVTIDPPLPSTGAHLSGDIIVLNWGKRTNFQMDTRVDPNGPAGKLKDEKGVCVGSSIDVPAYQRGEFEGNGKRLLPAIPAELKAAWPDPCNPVVPSWGVPSAGGGDEN